MNNPIICVVDDEVTVLRAIERTLKSLGVQVKAYTSAKECLRYLSRHQCHLLITDFKMPDMDGLELVKRARALAPWLPVIVITGFGDVPLAVKAINMGACDFIEKPLERATFLVSVIFTCPYRP